MFRNWCSFNFKAYVSFSISRISWIICSHWFCVDGSDLYQKIFFPQCGISQYKKKVWLTNIHENILVIYFYWFIFKQVILLSVYNLHKRAVHTNWPCQWISHYYFKWRKTKWMHTFSSSHDLQETWMILNVTLLNMRLGDCSIYFIGLSVSSGNRVESV